MKSSVKISLIALLVVVIGTTFFMKKQNEKVEVLTRTEPTKNETMPVFPKADGAVSKNTTPVVKKELPENPYLTKESLISLSKEMKEFLILDMKSIKNTEETKEYYSLLRSPAALSDAQKILLSVNSEREHLAATRFFAKALGDLNNKSNKGLNEIVKKVILEDNLSGPYSEAEKMIFAGDKAELAQTYIAFNPNGHKDLLDRAKTPIIKKIVENAYAYNTSMRAGSN
ncbi:MAG: hypothetical protein K2Q18_18955 [Bdellovibrionales bacterium]|nr:hypothetical protein [Bdellovibrionales bacterium]